MTRSEMRDLVPGYVRLEENEIKSLVNGNDGKLNVAQCNLLNITILSSESWLQLNKNQWIKESLFKKLMAVRSKNVKPQTQIKIHEDTPQSTQTSKPYITNLDFYSLEKI